MVRTRGLSITRITTGQFTEPVTLAALKQHAEIDFADHDILLTTLLRAARKEVEDFLNLSLVDTKVTARWEELGREDLPYGPVKSIISVTDGDGEAITSHKLEGIAGGFRKISADREEPTEVTYQAGFAEEVPYDIQLAIMKLATTNFEFRTGISLAGASKLPNDWRKTCISYRRVPWTA